LPIHSAQRAQPNIFDISDGVKRISTRNNKRVITGLTPGRYANRSGEYEVLVDGTVWLIGGQDLPDRAERVRVAALPPDAAMTEAAMGGPAGGGTTPPGRPDQDR
jgi:hypothetical protein